MLNSRGVIAPLFVGEMHISEKKKAPFVGLRGALYLGWLSLSRDFFIALVSSTV
jgi:hypothetical protein